MKRIVSVLALTVILAACGGTSSTATVCKEQYWDGTIGTCLPAGWSIVPREKLAERGLPEEVIAAFQRGETISGQTPVLLVTKEALTQDVKPKDYSDASIRSVSALPSYKLIDSRDEDIDGDKVQIHIYTAQPVSSEPARRFYQLSTVKNKVGYTFTALAPVSVPSALDTEILTMLKAATLKGPSSSSK
ncbi:MAG: hypothetical protein JWM56_1117 [Candidatus Peribacteria bacterium]|nr:hypothetical protein [Candidatus Peribacteria bacterium]